MVLDCYKRYTYVYIPRLSKLERYLNMAFLCLLPYSCRTDAIQLILPPSKCFHPMEVACLRGMSAWICTSKIWCATSARSRTWAIAFTFCKCLPWFLMLIYVYLMVTFGLLAYPCLFDVTCSQAVWGSQGAGDAGPTWQVFNTNDLPSPGRNGWKRMETGGQWRWFDDWRCTECLCDVAMLRRRRELWCETDSPAFTAIATLPAAAPGLKVQLGAL